MPKKLLMLFGLLPVLSNVGAVEIDLVIEGQGKVTATESSMECTSNCTISNNASSDHLYPTANEGERFLGWQGHTCDQGDKVLTDSSFHTFSEVKGGAKTLTSADIDNDGLIDLAQISLFDGAISILYNHGNASFTSNTLAHGLAYPTAMDFYDWDNDGDQDLLVVEYGRKQIKLYKNSGTGSFSFDKNISVDGTTPYAITIEDINNDTLPDLAISSFTADTSGNLQTLADSIDNEDTSWYINNGSDKFTHHVTLSNKAAITMDVAKDAETGIVNVIAAELTKGSISLYQLAEGIVTSKELDRDPAPYGTVFGDIDDDGILDVLSAFYRPSRAKLVYGLGNHEYSKPVELKKFAEGVTATAIVDVDQDGYKDAVLGEFNNDKFGYIPTISYEGCVVTSAAKISLTAKFSSSDTSVPTPSPTPETQPSVENSSGGGSNSLLFLITLAFITLFRVSQKR